jgi:hypothetical protein
VDTVVERVGAGEHRAVGRKGEGNGGEGIFEEDALICDGVNIRGSLARVAVAA